LIGDVADSMAWAAALGELLSWFRVAGLDAQGAVLEREDDVATSKCRAGRSLSPALIRMGRIYLAELVAVAMDVKPQPMFPPTFCLAQQTGTDSGTSRATGDESRSAQAPLELGGRQ
jgi:sirohydrochlorin ferrochelatase